jgi:hypothetical protein
MIMANNQNKKPSGAGEMITALERYAVSKPCAGVAVQAAKLSNRTIAGTHVVS